MLNLLKQAPLPKNSYCVVFSIQNATIAGFIIVESKAGKAFPVMRGGWF